MSTMNKLRAAADAIKAEYEAAVRSCSWDDDVAEVLKHKIFEIINKIYFDVLKATGPISCTPIESGEASPSDISNMQNVSQDIDKIVSNLSNMENFLNNFKI